VIRLVGAELLRLSSRRLFRTLFVLAIAGVIAGGTVTFFTSTKDPEAGLAEAREQREACLSFRAEVKNAGEAERFECPTAEQFARDFDKRFRFADQMPETTRGTAILWAVLAFVVGASFAGAEWGTGSMATYLTWEPRRGRVLASKLICAVVVAATGAVLLSILLALVHIPAAYFRGTTAGMTGGLWASLAEVWGRAGGLAAIAGVFGVGAATVSRNTAGAVGAAAAYFAILDPIASYWRRAQFRGWLFQWNIASFLGFELPADPREGQGGQGLVQADSMRVFPIWRPALLLSLYALALAGIAYATFRARDVT
jgi:ABC-2 type transport system permease protein